MKCTREMMRLYAVTDRRWTGNSTLLRQVESAIKGGATCIQLREKELDERSFLEEAVKMRELCRNYGVPLIINDNVELALECGADGVHVGQKDMEAGRVREIAGDRLIIGVSARTVEQALSAYRAGADYLGCGAVFSTSTKTDASALSHDVLREICDTVDIPVVAIGGITKANMPELAGTHADGAALVSAVFSAEDIESECRELRALSEMIFSDKL